MSNGHLEGDSGSGGFDQSAIKESDQETATFINRGDDVRRKSSSSARLFQVVRGVMTRRSSSPHNNPSAPGTPLSSKRSQSMQSPASLKRKMFFKNRFKSTWMSVDVNEEDLESNDVCKLSDSPNWTFKLATKGNVKQLAAICNVNPDRMMARDRKGATVLHYAAANEQISMIEFILSFPGANELLNATDDLSATPLHWAIENDKPNSVRTLLTKGANPALKNSSGYPALHFAVQKNSLNSLKVLVDKKVDIHVRGNAGISALHVGATTDNAEAFKILLDAGAKPCMSCTQGYYPLHAAALSGSRNVMTLLLDHCQKYGYSSEGLLSYGDKENSSPLHCAVTGGNIVAIKLCLDYGARLDVKQADDSTPMHMVCGQGTLDIVKTMFEIAPEQAQASLSMLDKMDHSPLHKAAMFNHPGVIKYLVEKGADLEVSDAEDRTPLLVAASRECWESVRVLIQLGANVLVKDAEDRNIMHIVILKGGDISKLSNEDIKAACRTIFQRPEIKQLLNEADSAGCSPLHYACQEGNLASLKTLMCLGVSARRKSCKKQSPLHFASMYGRFNATRRLLDSAQGPNIINEKDEEGMTPLHFAAKNGHVKVLQLLLNRGAIVHRNIHGESPLHVAASSGYTKTIRTLIETHNHLIDQPEAEGNSALHLAAKNGHVSAVEVLMDLGATFLRNNLGATCFTEAIVNQNRDVAMAIVQHDRWEEAMSTFYEHEGQVMIPIMLLIQYLPDVCVALLNRCKETADVGIRSKNYWIRYHFKYLEPAVEKRQELWKVADEMKRQRKSSKDDDDDSPAPERLALPALNKMVEFNRVECLRHPVSVQYLRQKWGAYGRLFHTINLLFYLMSLFPITYIASTVPSGQHFDSNEELYTEVNGTMVKVERMRYSGFQIAMMVQLTIINIGQIIKECVQIFQQRFAYFTDLTNVMEWTLYLTSVLYVVPFLTGYPVHWQFEVGAIAIFLAWFNLLIFLQKFDIAGIYVVMFLQILRTLVQVILVFSFLMVAFGLAFYVLMQDETDKAFEDPAISMLRITTMLLGEIGYVEKFLTPFVDDDPATFHFGIPSLLLLLVFILMMPILLMNLLIGLAVGDIAQVQNNAVLQRLAMQVQLHSSIETRLPFQFLMRVDKPAVTLYPNRYGNWHKRIWRTIFQYTGIQADYGNDTDGGSDPSIEYLQTEMARQKQRLKTIQTSLDKQHDLLRLIVQKMEIRSEAEDQDEGTTPSRYGSPPGIYSSLPGHSGSKLMALRALKALK